MFVDKADRQHVEPDLPVDRTSFDQRHNYHSLITLSLDDHRFRQETRESLFERTINTHIEGYKKDLDYSVPFVLILLELNHAHIRRFSRGVKNVLLELNQSVAFSRVMQRSFLSHPILAER